MIEIFKTNVTEDTDAAMLLETIHLAYPQYKVNFDLDDCDHILRVECANGYFDSYALIRIVSSLGFYAEILSDNDPFDDQKLVWLKSKSDTLILT